jgi:hypothetical protein
MKNWEYIVLVQNKNRKSIVENILNLFVSIYNILYIKAEIYWIKLPNILWTHISSPRKHFFLNYIFDTVLTPIWRKINKHNSSYFTCHLNSKNMFVFRFIYSVMWQRKNNKLVLWADISVLLFDQFIWRFN